MNKQFTASEVRSAIGAIEARDMEYEAGMLRAFADLLEAQEKAEAIGFLSAGALAALVDCRSDDYNGNVDLWMRSNDAVKATIPVYTHPDPSNAERLAEALRKIAREPVNPWPDPFAHSHEAFAYAIHATWCDVNRIAKEALAAHYAQAQPPANTERLAELLRGLEIGPMAAMLSPKKLFAIGAAIAAQAKEAQPPAASVPDAMQELADKYHELLWAVARKFPGETRHETALRYIREAECQEAALAAQENPNG